MEPADAILNACVTLARAQAISVRTAVLLGAELTDVRDALRRVGIAPIAAGQPIADPAVAILGWRRGIMAELDAACPSGPFAAALIVGAPAARRADIHRALFDRGLFSITPPREEVSVYVQSALLANPSVAGEGAQSVIAMSNLGHNAGFANQLFQYSFLRLYGLRNDAAVETPAWIGEDVYGFARRPIARELPMVKGDQWSVRDLALWTDPRPPVNVDFWGYFQNPPPCWRAHRAFLRRLFAPLPPWREPISRWLERHRPPGTTLVAIHVRRGDYILYGSQKPWFRPIPEAWYLRWLAQIWPTLENPVLFVATDDRDAVLPAFAAYSPLVATDAEAEMPEPRFLADFEIMAQAELLAVCNSSFSHMAALLAPPRQRTFIASIEGESFEPYDPWATDDFWRRFGAPTARPRSLLPRFLRRRSA
ncbi:MAG TPA: alpha-1,2-fucosyltransferase [Stellaceae bacterium]|nr:alpha-1,2-fucosyltransferase [Stellaceae bacterium]